MKHCLSIFLVLFALVFTPWYGAGAQGPSNILTVTSITQLRAAPAKFYTAAYLTQYNSTTGMGGGVFYYNGSSSCSDDGGVLIQASGGCYRRDTTNQPYSVAWFGAQCGGQQVVDGVSSVSGAFTHTITSATATWTAAMVGWQIVVNGAGTSGQQVASTIATVTPPHTLTYAATTATAGTGLTVSVYPDDTTAISKTVTAANRDNASMAFPPGKTCGVANPGSASYWNLTFPALYLNGATVWLGQTGPTSDTGWGFNMEGVNTSGSQWTGVVAIGPGTLDGLYQTNQGVQQNSILDTLVWNDGGGTTINNGGVTGRIVIQNTKGVAVIAQGVNNFTISDVLAQNCGDYSYQHSGTPGDMVGRPMCVTIQGPVGTLNINNLTSNNAAQAGLLIQNSGGEGPQSFHAQISGCSFTGNGYYGLDIEQVGGAVDVTNCRQIGNGTPPSGALISGGYIVRDVAYLRMCNIESYLTDGNAFVMESVSGPEQTNWSFCNVDITGTASHAGAAYFDISATGVPQRISLENFNTDTITVVPTSSPACSTTKPRFQLFEFSHLNVSQNSGPTYSTIFEPFDTTSGHMLYVLGRDSNLGAVQMNYQTGTHSNTILYDLAGVQMNGAPTLVTVGSVAYGGASTAGATTVTNPAQSFVCP